MEKHLLSHTDILHVFDISTEHLSATKQMRLVLVLSYTAKALVDILRSSNPAPFSTALQSAFHMTSSESDNAIKGVLTSLG